MGKSYYSGRAVHDKSELGTVGTGRKETRLRGDQAWSKVAIAGSLAGRESNAQTHRLTMNWET